MGSLRLEGVSKSYGSAVAVKNLNLEVREREFVVIFGAAGAGKTTTLNLIAGIAVPDSGRVILDGQVANTVEPSDRDLAMVFENYALYPQLTVYENMAFPLKSPKIKMNAADIRTRVTEVARTLKIDHLLGRGITALSNGQRQRTALGRALVRKPKMFLMDEPLSHLDAKLRNLMRIELKLVQSELDTTTLYVTHDYLEALSLGNRIVILDGGEVLQIGTPDEVYLRPATVTVAQGFGDPEINLLDITVSRTGAQTQAVPKGGGRGFTVDPAIAGSLGSSSYTLGFRPADVQLRPGGDADVSGTVYSFEPLGARAVLIVESHGTLFRALVDGETEAEIGSPAHFSVAPENLIFFGPGGRFVARSQLRGEA